MNRALARTRPVAAAARVVAKAKVIAAAAKKASKGPSSSVTSVTSVTLATYSTRVSDLSRSRVTMTAADAESGATTTKNIANDNNNNKNSSDRHSEGLVIAKRRKLEANGAEKTKNTNGNISGNVADLGGGVSTHNSDHSTAKNKGSQPKKKEKKAHYKYLTAEIPTIPKEKSLATPERVEKAWKFFRDMGEPKWHVAPMVDASELAFRMLCRKYGATCAYTPMMHARLFNETEKYRKEQFTTCAEDRPLLAQFCANDPQVLLSAARHVEAHCDAVDINLGCPQRIARRGNYGSFLMEDLETVRKMVYTLATELSIPVTCKIRIFPEREKTLQYAKMLEDAGCSLLAVHGRTREQKDCREVRADWSIIKDVKDSLKIPVLANGNIRNLKDAKDCLEYTGCDGVLSAGPLLKNPTLFSDERPETGEPPCPEDPCNILLEYLDLCETYDTPQRMIRGHVHKLLRSWFEVFPDVRERMNNEVSTVQLYRDVAHEMKDLIRKHHQHQHEQQEEATT